MTVGQSECPSTSGIDNESNLASSFAKQSLPTMHTQSSSLGLSSGLRAFLRGIGFVLGTPSVWHYALVPSVMFVILATGLGTLGIWEASRLGETLVGSSGTWAHIGNWALTLVLALAAILLAILFALCLAQPFSGFALERMVSARERALTGWEEPRPGFVESTVRSLVVALVTLAVAVPVFAGLIFINFLFPAALIVTLPLKFLCYGWLLAWSFLDYPLSIYRIGLWARARWVLRHFDAFTAFGLAWAVVGLVPGVILVLLPMGVAGATDLVVEADQGVAEEVSRAPKRWT